MKYVIVQADGLVQQACGELEGKTPLQAAHLPYMDRVVQTGELGRLSGGETGPLEESEMISLGLLGYDPKKYVTGPAAFEAAGLGVSLNEQDVAFRCSMVTLKSQETSGSHAGHSAYSGIKKFGPHVILEDETACDIETEDARELIEAVNEQLGSETIQFYPGTGSRHLMVWVGGKAKTTCVDPRVVRGQPIPEFLPKGDGSDNLRKLIEASYYILEQHPVNEERIGLGLKPANCFWLWGAGRDPKLPKVSDRFQLTGAVLAKQDLVRGLGVFAGLEAIALDELNETGDPTWLQIAQEGLQILEKKDVVFIHITLQQDGQDYSARESCEQLEVFDRDVIGVLQEGLEKLGPHRFLLVGGVHPQEKASEQVPLYGVTQGPSTTVRHDGHQFHEIQAQDGSLREASKLAINFFSRGS